MVVVPTARPITRPEAKTAATSALSDVHVTARPVRTVPFASRATAVSCTDRLTTMLADVGDTDTLATGTSVTVTLAVPWTPSIVAVIVTVPALTPVTRPLPSTTAIVVLMDRQVTPRPL